MSRYNQAMDQQTFHQVAVLIERLGRLLGNDAHASNLQPVQWETLRFLDRANRFSRTSSALTAYLGTTKGTVSQTVKALEAKGLVRNRTNPKDRRRNQLSLSAKGKKRLAQDPMEKMLEATETLPADTIDSMASGLQRLLSERLSAPGSPAVRSVPRLCLFRAVNMKTANRIFVRFSKKRSQAATLRQSAMNRWRGEYTGSQTSRTGPAQF